MYYEDLLQISIHSAILAGNEIMKIYQTHLFIETKEDNSPVTEADIVSNEIIYNQLQKSNIPIISEESFSDTIKDNLNSNLFWLIDPLDGTKEFIQKNGEFTINLALIENRKPVLGVVYSPADGRLFFASPQTGAMKVQVYEKSINTESLVRLPLKKTNNDGIRIAISRSHVNEETQNFVDSLKILYPNTKIMNAGSSIKLCLIAEGIADIYPRFGRTKEWDIAAGHAILSYTNAEIIDLDTFLPLSYGKKELLNPNFIAIRKDIKL